MDPVQIVCAFVAFHLNIAAVFLKGEACSTCTAVRGGGVWCVCHYKKCNKTLQGILFEEVIEVDELDKGNISAAAGKQHE